VAASSAPISAARSAASFSRNRFRCASTRSSGSPQNVLLLHRNCRAGEERARRDMAGAELVPDGFVVIAADLPLEAVRGPLNGIPQLARFRAACCRSIFWRSSRV
jgi:hypothetical protein